jgi:rhodanese-related sulfurtransferase
MEVSRLFVSAQSLYARFGTAGSPLIVDVRREPAFAAAEQMIPGAVRCAPETIGEWTGKRAGDRPVVVYGVHGAEVSQNAAAQLREAGIDAVSLAGGIEGWAEAGLPLRKKSLEAGSCWVTRERPKIDRIACPWLIRRFIDPEAGFLYMPTERVFDTARERGAIAYDIPGAEPFSHDGEKCSFDAFLKVYDIRDPALDTLALIVRGADTDRLGLTPQSPGLLAITLGLSANNPDDHTMLEHGTTIYDALYAWCRSLQGETHGWNPDLGR